MSRHTAGPWTQTGIVIWSLGHGVVCEVSEPRPPERTVQHNRLDIGSLNWDEGMANAHLIATAPDLLAACKAIDEIGATTPIEETWSYTLMTEKLFQCREIARAAIAKAESE